MATLTLPRAPFGSTGHDSTRVIFGAAALGGMSQERADTTMELVRTAGINHIDTAASYGASEDRLQPFLADHRDEFFLATKTGERAGGDARAELERSLERMGVDSVDLIQLHNLVAPDQWARAFAPDGAVAALAAARDEGLVRFIGVTGHGLDVAARHIESLDAFAFDSVLFPYNHTMRAFPEYRADVERLLTMCAERGVAVQTIKSIARRNWADGKAGHFSWYEPLTEADPIDRAVRYVLGRPGLFLNTSSDARLLPMVLEAGAVAAERGVPGDAEMDADVAALEMAPLFDEANRNEI